MKNQFFAFLLIIISSMGCSDDDEKESTQLKFYEDASLQASGEPDFFFVNVGSGDNLVFEYEYNVHPEPQVADSGFSEYILLEIEPSLTEISMSGDELSEINAYYRQSCFCENVESVKIKSGSIRGTKINETTWELEIDVNIDFSEDWIPILNKQVSGIFKLSEM